MVGLNEFALHMGLGVNPFSLQDKSRGVSCVGQALGDGLLKSHSGHTSSQSAFVSLIGCMFIQLHTETVLSTHFELLLKSKEPKFILKLSTSLKM